MTGDVDVVFVLLALGGALWGALTGALVPRAAYRLSVPPDDTWRGECPEGHPLGGWLGLARCGHGHRYGPRTAVVTAATAAVCAALALTTGARPELGAWLLLAPFGVLLTVVDFGVHRLPDVLTLPLAGAALALLGGAALLPEHGGSWTGALYGAPALAGAYFVLFLINPNGMGFGDVKLALALGAALGWYGWGVLLIGTFAGFLLASLYGIALVAARRAGRKTAIPFGPFLLGGAFVGVLLGAYTA
ncbi:prepilin peptidase [Streptomyces sp. NPDC015345]|uniref:prepilin peptidase n=1 Tax=Streptomyces sp. NPDC015345 TaxID=3364953 RepID=UPI0037012BDB